MLYPGPTSGDEIDVLGLKSVDDVIHTDLDRLKAAANVSRFCNISVPNELHCCFSQSVGISFYHGHSVV